MPKLTQLVNDKIRFGTRHLSIVGSPGGSMVRNPPANAGDPGLITGSGRSPGEGHGSPFQYPFLENFIPWTEEPAKLQSIGSQRVIQD